MIREKMFRIKKGLAVALTGAFIMSGAFKEAGGFSSATHKYVTESSLKIISSLEIEDHEDIHMTKFKSFFKQEDWGLLSKFSVIPDDDENQGMFKYHFYYPPTGKNFMREKSVTARTKFEAHFQEAVRLYKEGKTQEAFDEEQGKKDKIQKAFEELGRAVHFFEDLNTPVHTVYQNLTDSVVCVQTHAKFEKICENIQEECTAEINLKKFEYYKVNSLGTLAKSAAILSGGNYRLLYGDIQKIIRRGNPLTTHKEENIAKNSVLNAQKGVVGIFYKFYNEVT